MISNNADIEVLLPILKKIPLFSGLEEDLHREIIQRIVLMYYPADYTIFNEGDEGDALYIVKKGSVKVFHPESADTEEEKVAEINEGGFFGEMALVSDVPRNASVKALTDLEVFILSKDDFKNLLDSNKVLAEQISATVVDRIKDNDK
ncbi:cyclic nucleotide-binding domain-containing protein [Candidatus Peregrinibacteria bacterium]|nr:cyclic nucleotide-binding domain-containing protein [Candidatus Peregrinibacteria bacterium]